MIPSGHFSRGYVARLTATLAILLLGLAAISWEWRHAHHLLHGHGGLSPDHQHTIPLHRLSPAHGI